MCVNKIGRIEIVSSCLEAICTGMEKGNGLLIKEDPDCAVRSDLGSVDSSSSYTEGSLERRDPMKVWQEMKENGFLTPFSLCRASSSPKKKRKKRSRNLENGQVNQVDGFANIIDEGNARCVGREICRININGSKMKVKVANKAKRFTNVAETEPSGLLKLNPGIITRIRNSEHVFSVIKALVSRDTMRDDNKPNKHVDSMEKKPVANGERDGALGIKQLETCSVTASTLSHLRSEKKNSAGSSSTTVERMDMKSSLCPKSENVIVPRQRQSELGSSESQQAYEATSSLKTDEAARKRRACGLGSQASSDCSRGRRSSSSTSYRQQVDELRLEVQQGEIRLPRITLNANNSDLRRKNKELRQQIDDLRLQTKQIRLAQKAFQRRMEDFMKQMGYTPSHASTCRSPALDESERDKETE